MRLSDDTAEIPDRLIALQEKGETVFLCGAGISQRYELPSFFKLTTDIYETLGETWLGYPAEEDAMGLGPDGERIGPAALDRALFALSKRLRGSDSASRIRAERLLTDAIEKSLKAPEGPFPAHVDVWTLSRDAEMRRRIVTTNFDTLFERAGEAGAASRACADLPAPLSTDFTGVLHLHGRIADPELNLSRTSLVLGSAEFGEAYLRSGWAARYVYDLARATTIVILGYGADDPPMRYILEVLTADRERYPDIREIFAFVPAKPDAASRERIVETWKAKGATAIPYDSLDRSDHDSLYRTISRWAEFAADPSQWRRAEAERILRQEPSDVTEGDWERLKWLLSGGDAGELLGQINPDPKWAGPLASADILGSGSPSPLRWILARLNDPEMPAAVAEHLKLSRETFTELERYLDIRDRQMLGISPILFQAWQLILDVANQPFKLNGARELRWRRTLGAVARGDCGLATKRDVLSVLRPRISIGRRFNWPGFETTPPPEELALRNVLRIDWGPGTIDKIDELVSGWPPAQRPSLIRALLRELEDSLEEAAETQTLNASSSDIRSISRHSQDQYPEGFYSIVRVIVDLWDVDQAERPKEARAVALEWLASPFLLMRRMGLHALRQSFFTSEDIAAALLALPDEDFWLGDARREIMQLFEHRWPTMGAEHRASVEERICAGLPRALLHEDAKPEQVEVVLDNAVFIRLSRIEGTGAELSAIAQQTLAMIRQSHPDWTSDGEKDDFRVWSSGVRTLGREGNLSLLTGVPSNKILERIDEAATSDPFANRDLWRLFCDADPQSALTALLHDDPTSANRTVAWQSFFWSLTSTERHDIHLAAFEAIETQEFTFAPFTAIAEWLLRKRSVLDVPTSRLLDLWDRLFAVVKAHNRPVQDQSKQDSTFSALNSVEGKIGTLLLDEYDRVRNEAGKDEQRAILNRMEQLVSRDGEVGFLGTAAVMEGLPALFVDHEDWAREWLLPLTEWSSPASAAAWATLLRQRIPQPELYAVLKPSLLEAGTHGELDRSIEAVAPWLIAPLLWAQAPAGPVPHITGLEVRQALVRAMPAVRRHAAWWLTTAMEQLDGLIEDRWRNRIGPVFKQIWPIEPACRDSAASVHLLRLALRTGGAFAEAAETIAPALASLEPWEIESYLGPDEDAGSFYDSAPEAVLTLLNAVVDEERVPSLLLSMLQRLASVDASLERDPRFMKLMGWARRRAAP